MSYLRHWKLKRSPFGDSSTSPCFFDGGSIDEAIARSSFLVQHERQLGVLAGPRSVGKSTLLKNLKSYFGRIQSVRTPFTVYVSMLGLKAAELPSRIVAGLQSLGEGQICQGPHAQVMGWQSLHDILIGLSIQNQRLVILLDDVDSISIHELDDVQHLLQMDHPMTCVLSITDPSLMSLTSYLRDRCELRIDLPAWDLGQTADYFDFCLTKAQAPENLFDAQSITRIQELSNGIPRRINQIGELCLVAGAVRQAEQISSSIVEIAVDELPIQYEFDYPGESAAA